MRRSRTRRSLLPIVFLLVSSANWAFLEIEEAGAAWFSQNQAQPALDRAHQTRHHRSEDSLGRHFEGEPAAKTTPCRPRDDSNPSPRPIGASGVAQPASVSADAGPTPNTAIRLVSLNPSLTAIVLRLGGADSLVGVDDYSARVLPEVADRPKVGGLFDPSLETVVALRPDRVLIVAGVDQQRHAERLRKLGLEVLVFQNERLDEVLENIERIGRLLDRERAAAARIGAILDMRAAVAVAARDRARPSTLVVVTRTPLFLVGAETFLDDMLEAVGARNLGRRLATGYPRGSIEWLIGVGPELLLDMTPNAEGAADFWARWPSLPAVAQNRVLDLDPARLALPGPDLDQALRALAVAVHGEEISAAIDRALGVPGLEVLEGVEVAPRPAAAPFENGALTR